MEPKVLSITPLAAHYLAARELERDLIDSMDQPEAFGRVLAAFMQQFNDGTLEALVALVAELSVTASSLLTSYVRELDHPENEWPARRQEMLDIVAAAKALHPPTVLHLVPPSE